MNIPVKDEVKKNIHIRIEKWFREKYPAFHDYLLKKYPDKKHIERLYLYYNNDDHNISYNISGNNHSDNNSSD